MIEIQNSKQVSGPEKVWSLVLGLWSFEHLNPSTLLRTGFDIVSPFPRRSSTPEDGDFDIRNSDL